MKQLRIALASLLALTLLAAAVAFAQQPAKPAAVKMPSIVGTYKLISRTLANGTKMPATDIVGLQTFTKTHRNFNVAWKNPDGKKFSLSIISTYKLTDKEYTENLVYMAMNDEIGGKGLTYDMTGQTKTSPVTVKGSDITLKLPFDPPMVTFSGSKITAVLDSAFTDYWEKIQ